MPVITKPSSITWTSVALVTAGALAAVWAAVWWVFALSEGRAPDWSYYVATGVLASGLVVAAVGLLSGRIGHFSGQGWRYWFGLAKRLRGSLWACV